jgi:hypothetical protein
LTTRLSGDACDHEFDHVVDEWRWGVDCCRCIRHSRYHMWAASERCRDDDVDPTGDGGDVRSRHNGSPRTKPPDPGRYS